MVEIFLIAVSLALDAFAVSVSSGISIPGFGVKQAARMGLWFGAFQFMMPVAGWLLGSEGWEHPLSLETIPRGRAIPDDMRRATAP